MAAEKLNSKRFAEFLQGEKPLLVDFWAPWCVHCRRIESAYEKIAESYGDEILVAKVNIDEEPALADRERIEMIPTLVLYRQGEALGSMVAPQSRASIEDFIRQTLGK